MMAVYPHHVCDILVPDSASEFVGVQCVDFRRTLHPKS